MKTSFKRLVEMLVATLCLILWAGCDDGNGGDEEASGPPTVDVSGVWTGTSTDATGSVRWRSGIRFDLRQNVDGTVQGTVTVAGTEAATGVVNGNRLTLTVQYSTSAIGSVGTYRLDVTGNELSGRYVESQWTNGKNKDIAASRSGS